MERAIITINESGCVNIPDGNVWMSFAEVVVLFDVSAPTLKAAIRDETIEQLQSNIKRMQVEHQKQIQEVKQLYEAENRKQSEYIDRILRYFPYVEKLMPMIKYLSERMGFNDNLIKALCTFKEIPVKGKLYSTMFNQSFSADSAVCSLKEDKEGRFDLRIDGVSHHSWFRRKKDEFMQSLGIPTRKQNKGIQL